MVVLAALIAVVLSVAGGAPASVSVGRLARIDHVADGDTVDLTNGGKVRLVQIDTPEVYFHPECYGKRASAITKRLLAPGTLVRLTSEPATDSVDVYGRLLRYVTRVRDGLNVNVGAQSPARRTTRTRGSPNSASSTSGSARRAPPPEPTSAPARSGSTSAGTPPHRRSASPSRPYCGRSLP